MTGPAMDEEVFKRFCQWATDEKYSTGVSPRRWIESIGWKAARALLEEGEAHATEAFRASLQLPLFGEAK